MKKQHAYFIFLLLFFTPGWISAQLSYGGAPLPFTGNTATLRSASDDFFIHMPSFDIEEMLKEDSLNSIAGRRAMRFARKFDVDITPGNSGIRFTTEDGTNVWRVGIYSEGAYSLNVLFTEFHLPEGGKVFLYNEDQTKVLGAFTEKNNPDNFIFPVAPVEGNKIIIEYQEPADVDFPGILRIGEVNHGYKNILKSRLMEPKETGCHVDPVCRDDIDDETQAICAFIVNGREYCTGSLINNVEEDGTPYFLTSCHCIESNGKTYEEVVSTIVVFFNYQSPACDSGIRGVEEMSAVSPVFRAADAYLDFALLELTDIPPADFRPYYLGWDLTEEPEGKYTGIHQPYGGIKKVAESDTFISLAPAGSVLFGYKTYGDMWHVHTWTSGTTEEGSSGSPLLDKNKKVIGALTGGGSYCSTPHNDYYWTLKQAWEYYPEKEKQLKAWLDPENKRTKTVDGLNPYSEEKRCVRISNLSRNEEFENYSLSSPWNGPLFGYNTWESDEYAEVFNCEEESFLYGVSLVTPVLANRSASKKDVYINIYSGGNEPDELIAGPYLFQPAYDNYSQGNISPQLKTYHYAAESYVRFPQPVKVGKKFFISYTLDYELDNSFSVYSAKERSTGKNTAYYKRNDIWTAVHNHPLKSMLTSLWINPVLQYGDFDPSGERFIHAGDRNDCVVYRKSKGIYTFIWQESLENITLEVYTIEGRKVKSGLFSGTETDLDISFLPDGIYIINMVNNEGRNIRIEKIVK